MPGLVEERPHGRGRTCLTVRRRDGCTGRREHVFRHAPFRIVDALPMRTCCIYAVRMSRRPRRPPPAAERVYAHVKQAVLGPPLRGRHAAHRGRARRRRRGVAHAGARGAAAAGGRGADQALPEEGRPRARRLRAGDRGRRGDPAAGRGVRGAQGRARVAAADRAARRAARASSGSRPRSGTWRPSPSPTAVSTPRSSAAPATRSSPASTTSCATASCGWASP